MTTTITDHVVRFVETRQALGYRFTQNGQMLGSFARFAEACNETFIRASTALAWASASKEASSQTQIRRLHTVHDFALWLHAEDDRHEVPHRDALGHASRRRPQPHLVAVPDIRKLLTAALSVGAVGTIAPLTWYYLFGLIAATGLRIGEALALTLDGITPDGLVIRDTKFGKTRMVALHRTSWKALNHYLEARLRETTPDRHVFVIATGRSPGRRYASHVSLKFAEQVGLRKPGAGADPALVAPFLRRPVPGDAAFRRQAGPAHAGSGHPSRARQCDEHLLVSGIDPGSAARHRRGGGTGSREWRAQ